MTKTCVSKRTGSDFDDFLSEQGMLEEVLSAALERVMDWEIAETIGSKGTSKADTD
jgi:hypothetical protein